MTPAIDLLKARGVPHTLHNYTNSTQHGYAEEAANLLNVDSARVFKTLVAQLMDERHIVAIVPTSHELDLKALAAHMNSKKARMADPTHAQRVTGYLRGGISPLGQKNQLPTAVDSSALEFPTLYVSAGRRGLEIELSPHDLCRLCDATLAPISKAR